MNYCYIVTFVDQHFFSSISHGKESEVKRKTATKTAAALFATILAATSLTTVVAYAANVQDTPWSYSVAASSSKDTESRAKTNQSRVYFNCETVSGSGVVQPCGKQKGSVYYWGPKFPVGKGLQYLTNGIYERRPATNVTTYCFLRFSNSSTSKVFKSTGLWSPDNSSGIVL